MGVLGLATSVATVVMQAIQGLNFTIFGVIAPEQVFRPLDARKYHNTKWKLEHRAHDMAI
jgi:hypothetical protein